MKERKLKCDGGDNKNKQTDRQTDRQKVENNKKDGHVYRWT